VISQANQSLSQPWQHECDSVRHSDTPNVLYKVIIIIIIIIIIFAVEGLRSGVSYFFTYLRFL